MEEYKNHAFTLLTIHNSVAPINTLPIEIFQKILVNVPSKSFWCDALWMLSLGSVCRQWRAVLSTTPEYWVRGLHTVMDSIFYDRYSDEDIAHGRNIFLTRSAPCPLEVSMDYSSDDLGPGWDAFEAHYDRVTVLEVMPMNEIDLDCVFDAMTVSEKGMKRLERLQVDGRNVKGLMNYTLPWEAQDLPCLGCLEITGRLFCREITVPSLHTVILTSPPRDIGSLPHLLRALENCPALAILRLELAHKDDTFQNKTPKRGLNLPKLRNLAVSGGLSDVRCFLTVLTFPSTTLVELDVLDTGNEQDKGLVLTNVLPRSLSIFGAHQMIDGVDRLCFHSKPQPRSEDERAVVCMRASVRGKERLHISPAFWLHSAEHFLQFLKLFRACRVTELALDLRHATSDMDAEFWAKFFTALPDVVRLQLLSPTANSESRAMKRDMAECYLASCGVPHAVPEDALVDFICRIAPPRSAVSLAWVLPCVDPSDPSRLDELGDVHGVLAGHADSEYIVLRRLELYLMAPDPDPSGQQAFDVTEVCGLDGMPLRMIDGLLIPGLDPDLEDAAEVVVFGSSTFEGFRVANDDHDEFDVDGIDDDPMEIEDD
ncbi:hypothetical protein GSI_04583 [Ganoderma sinense ZZ0214-1]|uniref:F-box domain-containing protein n=1 Tax=Ganoderma sinense ZZ0214-1 TaxID=1077348 RepID=A0A2G8SH80_9APHY|nr:hypothetical protein GSI_04583 [Ganoderma sinense ZZ0214-1]